MTIEEPKARWAEFPLEIIAAIAEFLPNGRDVFSFTLVCRTYHALLDRRLYVRFAAMPAKTPAELPDKWCTVHTTQRRPRHAARQRILDHNNVLIRAVENNQTETIRKFCAFVMNDSLPLRCSVRAAYVKAAEESQEKILETFLQNAREYVDVRDLIRENYPLRLVNVQLALKYGLDLSDPEPIMTAMEADDIEVPRLLLSKGANPEHRKEIGTPVAYFAAKRNDARFLQLLVDYGADLKKACGITKSVNRGEWSAEDYIKRRHSPVVAAACVARNTNCLHFLIENDFFNPAGGETCNVFLEELCDMEFTASSDRRRDHREVWARLARQQNDSMRLLINRGLDVNSVVHSDSLLAWAACRSNAEMVELLLQRGATVDTLNDDGMTPLAQMFENRGFGLVRSPFFMSVKLLVEAGACINSFKDGPSTPLCASVRCESRELFNYLLDSLRSGANFAKNDTAQKQFKTSGEYMQAALDDGGQDGDTPLMVAARHGSYNFADRLLELGADPCGRGRSGLRPLHIAVREKRDSICRLLLLYGADAFQKDDEGRDALSHANNERWFVRLVRVERAKRVAAANQARSRFAA